MKKILSLFIAVVLAVTTLSFGTTAFAAEKACFTVTMTGRQYNSVVQGTTEDINAVRTENGLDGIALDYALTVYAQDRAAEIMLFVDENDELRPDGTTVESGMPANIAAHASDCFLLSGASRSELTEKLQAIGGTDFASVKSMGMAVFGKNDVYVAYVIISTAESETAFTEMNGQAYKKNIKILESNVSAAAFDLNVKNSVGLVEFKMYFIGSGAYDKALVIPNSQLTYTSSNSKVFKIKNNRGFIKKKGKATITAKSKSGKLLDKQTVPFTETNYKLNITKAYSKKKGTAFLQWQKNVTNASGYQIQYSTDKSCKKGVKTVTIKGYKNCKKTITKLKSKKTYYFRVRAYIDQGYNEKAYSSWSSKVSLRIK